MKKKELLARIEAVESNNARLQSAINAQAAKIIEHHDAYCTIQKIVTESVEENRKNIDSYSLEIQDEIRSQMRKVLGMPVPYKMNKVIQEIKQTNSRIDEMGKIIDIIQSSQPQPAQKKRRARKE